MPGVLFLLKCQSVPQNPTENGSGSSSSQGSLTELRGVGEYAWIQVCLGGSSCPWVWTPSFSLVLIE